MSREELIRQARRKHLIEQARAKQSSANANPQRANDILDKGVMMNFSPGQVASLSATLSPQDMEMETAKSYYDNKFGMNHAPEMIEAQIAYEYGDDATPQVANQMNRKALKYTESRVAGVGKQALLGVEEAFAMAAQGVFGLVKNRADKLVAENQREYEALVSKGKGDSWRAKAFSGLANWHTSVSQAMTEEAEYVSRFRKEETERLKAERQGFVEQVARGVGQLARAPLAMTPLAPAALGGAMYQEGLDETNDEDKALRYALIATPIEYVSDMFMLGTGGVTALRGLKGKELAKVVTSNIKPILAKLGMNFVSEGATEVLQDGVLNKISGQKMFDENSINTFLVSGTVGLFGGAMGATSEMMTVPMTVGDANRMRQQMTDEQIAQAEESGEFTPEEATAVREAAGGFVEQNVEEANRSRFEPDAEVADAKDARAGDVAIDGQGQVRQEAPGKEAVEAVDIDEGVIRGREVDSLELSEISDRAQVALETGERAKSLFKPVISLSTRIKEIAPRASLARGKSEQKTNKIIMRNTESISEFAQSTKRLKKSSRKEDWPKIKAEILNGDWAALEARGIEGIPRLRQMFTQTAESLGIPSIENYFRRKVKDYDGLIQHLGAEPKGRFKKALDARAKELGRKLTQNEKRATIRNELRTHQGTGLKAKRTIDTLTPEMAEFYEDPLVELENYIRQSAQAISRKELLGIDQGVADELGEVEPTIAEEDISSIIAEMSEEGMTRKQEQELGELLKSALEYKRSPEVVDAIRRGVSIKYVTKLKTTVKQWGDTVVSMGENGVYNVMGSGKEAKNWTDQLGGEVELSLQEQGIEKLDAELQATKRKQLEEAVFKPLQSQDLLGKRILMRSTAMKWRRMAKSDPQRLKKQLDRKFRVDEFVDGIIKDMQNGVLSEDVSFALYSQMADFHPISHSQHIKLYIDQPLLRPLFMLKSFAFKRFDRLYREGVSSTIDGLAKSRAAAIDKNEALRKEAADDLASGILGLSRFFILAVGGEVLIEKIYKEAMQALGFAPDEIPEDESWVSMYMQELGRIAPFIDPFSLEKAYERGDPWLYFEEAHDIPAPWGSDAAMDLIKHLRGKKDADVNKWKKDIPWFGELMWGAEQESRERELMRKRRKQEKR